MLYKIAAIALVFLGEAFSIGGELFSSKEVTQGHYVVTFTQMFFVMTLGGALLIAGYMVGYLYLKNIWIVVAVSIATLAIGEPLLAAVLFGESPTTGSLIGLILGILGLLSALFVP